MAAITQAEFNAMLQTAIAQGLPGGYVPSKWSWEEIEARIESVPSAIFINQTLKIPNKGSGWYRIASGSDISAFVAIRHQYSISSDVNILFYYSILPFMNPVLFVLSSHFTSDVNKPIDRIRITRLNDYNYCVDFHFSQEYTETVMVSQSLCGGRFPNIPPPIVKVADAPAGETIIASVSISKNMPNGYI